MATLTVTTNPLPTGIGGLFQINYGEKSIQELCNFESSLEDATIESKSKYNGATLIRPLHIQFNKSASATAFGGAAPTPGQETFATISVTVTTIQGACKYEYQANVLSQGDHAYAQVAQTMAQGFVKALALFKDRCLYTGNCTKLVFNQHISGSSSGGSVATWATSDFHQRCDATYTAGDNLTDGGNAGALTLEAAGELSAFIGAIPSDDSTWVPVLLVRNDNAFNGAEQMPGVPYGYTYASKDNGMLVGTDANEEILTFVAGVDVQKGKVLIAVCDIGAAGDAYLTTDVISAGFGGSIELDYIQAKDGAAANIGVDLDPASPTAVPLANSYYEPHGLMYNLCSPLFWSLDRSSGATVDEVVSPNNRAQSFVSTLNQSGAQNRVPFIDGSDLYFQNVLDSIDLCQNLAGQDGFERFIAATSQRAKYMKIFTQTQINNFGDRSSIDPGAATGIAKDTKNKPWLQQSFTLFGYPVGLSQGTPNRVWFAWKKDQFERIHADKGHWMPGVYEGMWNYIQTNTGILTANLFAWWIEMYETFTTNPHSMFLLTGME